MSAKYADFIPELLRTLKNYLRTIRNCSMYYICTNWQLLPTCE